MEIFGISMTLFHYYTYSKCFRSFDKFKLATSCIFLAAKIKGTFFHIDKLQNLHKKYKNMDISYQDIIYFELDLMNFLGFEIEINTPYSSLEYLFRRKEFTLIKNLGLKSINTKDMNLEVNNKDNEETLKSLCYNIINDCYRRPLCILFTPEIIALSSLAIAIAFLYNFMHKHSDTLNIEEDNDKIELNEVEKVYNSFYSNDELLNEFNICLSEMIKLLNTKFKDDK